MLSVRRATVPCIVVEYASSISIHALREESDQCGNYQPGTSLISIHALREESDVFTPL